MLTQAGGNLRCPTMRLSRSPPVKNLRAFCVAARHLRRVRAPALFVNELLIPRLEAFCEAHPLIDVQLDTRDPRPVAHPPSADVSIVLADTPPAGVRSARLFSSPLSAVRAAGPRRWVSRGPSRAR